MTKQEFDDAFRDGAMALYSMSDIYKSGEKNMFAFIGAAVFTAEMEKSWQKHIAAKMETLKAMQTGGNK